MAGAADKARRQRNQEAWRTLSGYRTTSGCPCWDKTRHVLIPKQFGFGYTCNLWAICCCFLCETPENDDPALPPRDPNARKAIMAILGVFGSATFIGGLAMIAWGAGAFGYGAVCSGYHEGSQYFTHYCPSKECCVDQCAERVGNHCVAVSQGANPLVSQVLTK